MSDVTKGGFAVCELPDGRFVAASSEAPYFCFRADSEAAVLEKVVRALTFYGQSQGVGNKVQLKSVTKTVTTLTPTKRFSIAQVLQDAA